MVKWFSGESASNASHLFLFPAKRVRSDLVNQRKTYELAIDPLGAGVCAIAKRNAYGSEESARSGREATVDRS